MSSEQPRYSHAGAALFGLLRELERTGDPLGLEQPPARLAVLRLLAQQGALTVSEIARLRGATRQGVQQLAHRLVQRGWLERRPNPRHRRSPLLRLTPAGRRVYQALIRSETERLNQLAEGLEPAALTAARRLLATLRERAGQSAAASRERAGRSAAVSRERAGQRSSAGGRERAPGPPAFARSPRGVSPRQP